LSWVLGVPAALVALVGASYAWGGVKIAIGIGLTAVVGVGSFLGYWVWGARGTWAGLMPAPSERWRLSVSRGALTIVAGADEAVMPVSAIRRAVHVTDEGWERIAGLDDALVLTTDEGALRISVAAEGFHDLVLRLADMGRLDVRRVG
jgi:hypothetical protein